MDAQNRPELHRPLSKNGGRDCRNGYLHALVHVAGPHTKAHVRVESTACAQTTRTFLFPRATPMGYTEETYDHFVAEAQAFDLTGKSLALIRTDGPKWQVGTATRVEYDVDLERMEKDVVSGTD